MSSYRADIAVVSGPPWRIQRVCCLSMLVCMTYKVVGTDYVDEMLQVCVDAASFH